MKKDDTSESESLRRKAEEKLNIREASARPGLTTKPEMLKLIHELEVHQVELEMMNEELRKARITAQESAEKYVELYELAPSGYCTLSKEGEITSINLAGAKMCGRNRLHLINSSFGFLISDETKHVFNLFHQKVWEDNAKETCEVTMRAGWNHPLQIQLTGILSENGKQCLLSMVDITRLKKDSTYLKLNRDILGILSGTENFRADIQRITGIIKATTLIDAVGVRMQDGEDYPYFYSDGFSTEFLNTENSILSRELDGGICRDGNGNVCLECTCGLVISGQADPSNPLFTPGGSAWTNDSFPFLAVPASEDPRTNPRNVCIHMGYASVALIPVRTGNKIIGLIQLNHRQKDRFTPDEVEHLEYIGVNIAEAFLRKQSEAEIQELNETLETRIAERTCILEATNRELTFHLSEIEQFVYIASHDLSEPLNVLTSFTSLLHEEYAGKLDEDGNKSVEFISRAATRMRLLLKGLLDYSLLGKDSVRSYVDCSNVVGAVLSGLSGSILECNARITVQPLPVVNGYSKELEILFENLVSNAVKFRKKDVVPEIRISAEHQRDEWVFSIEDNGIGLDRHDREKIFDIFKRMVKRNDYDGAGIGLAHCKKITEMHGGRIWAESNEIGGSTFRFTIPALRNEK
ncbi:MAG: ATP-binding protein [bacterium]